MILPDHDIILISFRNEVFALAQANPYPLRVDRTIMEKFKVIASSNGRSVNKELEMLMKAAIADYENRNGEIQIQAPYE